MSAEVSEAVAAMIASRAEERKLAYERGQASGESLADFRTVKQERRRWGLKARHAAKLARNLATE